MADFAAQFLLNDVGLFQGHVDSIPQEVFLEVSAPQTSPTITITPSSGSSVARAAGIQVDVTDDLAALADVTIWAVLADGTTETIWNGAAFTAKFSGSTSALALGTRFTFAYAGFGWPTTAVTVWAKAVDPVGAAATPVSAAYTITDPPAAPTIGPFTPTTGGSQARAASVQVDVTDAEGASALTMILVTAITSDGTRRRVAAGATISPPFTGGSSRSSISGGYRYVVAWDAPGWPSATAELLVEAQNAHGLFASASWSATVTDPPAAPVVGGFLPASSGSVTRTGSIRIEVTDDEGEAAIQKVRISATLSDDTERDVYNGTVYTQPFAGSSVTSITGGKRFTFAHVAPGWSSTALYFRVEATDAQGRITTSTSYTLTISDPPAAPVIDNFSPTDGGTTTRAGTVRVDVTDDEGASAIAHVEISAELTDGSVRVVYAGSDASDFTDDFVDGSSRAGISGGYRYHVAFNGDGWPSSDLHFVIRATDTQGRTSEATLDLTITDPPPGPDVTAPTVTFAPTGGPIAAGQPITVIVSDPGQLRRVVIAVRYPSGLDERAWTGYAFTPFYQAGSSVAGDLATGLTFVLARSGGWLGDPTPEVLALDKAGNEA